VKAITPARYRSRRHRESAAFIWSFSTPDGWTQIVAVGYERIRGLRNQGQQRDTNWFAGNSIWNLGCLLPEERPVATFGESVGDATPCRESHTRRILRKG
jgi:hypothetical protein